LRAGGDEMLAYPHEECRRLQGIQIAQQLCAGLAAGTLAGWLNGLIIVGLRVPPLIVTLATLAIFRGLSFGISESRSVHGFPEWFGFFGSGEIFGLPVQLYLLAVVATISGVALARTPFGRTLYAIGNNETAARFSGLNVRRAKLIAYTLSGFMAGLAGLVFTSRVTTTRADAATGIELDVFTAIAAGASTPALLAAKISASERGLRILCDYLTIMGLLTKENGRYALTEESALFLDRRSPASLVAVTGFLGSTWHKKNTEALTEAVRKGGTVGTQGDNSKPQDEVWVAFARSMAPLTRPAQTLSPKSLAPPPLLSPAVL